VQGTNPATVLGTELRTSPELAAFVNGAMVRYLDFSDDFFGGTGDIGPHPSDNICAILAACESARGNGQDFILGTVIAYEACCRITEAIDVGTRARTWDYPVLHSIASSLGAAKSFDLSIEQTRHALSLAVVPNICLYETRTGELSNWKGFAGPNGSRNGVFAALLSKAGITGPQAPFEGRGGLKKHLGIPFEIGIPDLINSSFKIENTHYKSIPVRYSAQLPILVALEVRKQIGFEQIAALCVFMSRRYVTAQADHPEYWNPCTRETADHSFPYLIAAALVDGEISDKTFSPERFRDTDILRLVQKITMAEDPSFSKVFPREVHCRFEIRINTGDEVSLGMRNPKGHPLNPMSDTEMEEKFIKQAANAGFSEGRSRDLLNRMWSLESVSNLQEFLSSMRVVA
jgi:2-methylcitrate dehydratase